MKGAILLQPSVPRTELATFAGKIRGGTSVRVYEYINLTAASEQQALQGRAVSQVH